MQFPNSSIHILRAVKYN